MVHRLTQQERATVRARLARDRMLERVAELEVSDAEKQGLRYELEHLYSSVSLVLVTPGEEPVYRPMTVGGDDDEP